MELIVRTKDGNQKVIANLDQIDRLLCEELVNGYKESNQSTVAVIGWDLLPDKDVVSK